MAWNTRKSADSAQRMTWMVMAHRALTAQRDARLKDDLSVVNEATVLVDADTGDLVFWNTPACMLFGYDAGERARLTVEALLPGVLDTWRAATEGAARIAGGTLVTLPAIKKNGVSFMAELSLGAFPGDAEERNYILVIVRPDAISQALTAVRAHEPAPRERPPIWLLFHPGNHNLNRMVDHALLSAA